MGTISLFVIVWVQWLGFVQGFHYELPEFRTLAGSSICLDDVEAFSVSVSLQAQSHSDLSTAIDSLVQNYIGHNLLVGLSDALIPYGNQCSILTYHDSPKWHQSEAYMAYLNPTQWTLWHNVRMMRFPLM